MVLPFVFLGIFLGVLNAVVAAIATGSLLIGLAAYITTGTFCVLIGMALALRRCGNGSDGRGAAPLTGHSPATARFAIAAE